MFEKISDERIIEKMSFAHLAEDFEKQLEEFDKETEKIKIINDLCLFKGIENV